MMKPSVIEINEFIESRIDRFEKDAGRNFSDEFKCGFYAGIADALAYAQELGEQEEI